MSSQPASPGSPYRGYRFPPEVIGHAVWLYFRFHLSFRDVQELLAERGVLVSHEAIRHWCYTFGPQYVGDLRRLPSLPPTPTPSFRLRLPTGPRERYADGLGVTSAGVRP